MSPSTHPLGHFSGLRILLRAESAQILRSPAMWVLAGVVGLSALLAPPTARYITEILSAAVDPALAAVLGASLPEPTWRDSYGEWLSNLNQLTVFALIIVAAIMWTGELSSGSAAFILTRHVGRSAYLGAKFLVFTATFLVFTLVGALLTWGLTAVLFDATPLAPLLTGTLSWCLGALLILSVILLAAAISSNVAVSAGAGFLTYIVLLMAAIWPPAVNYSPAGLNSLASALLGGSPPDGQQLWIPAVSTLLLCLVLLVLTLEVFKRKELH